MIQVGPEKTSYFLRTINGIQGKKTIIYDSSGALIATLNETPEPSKKSPAAPAERKALSSQMPKAKVLKVKADGMDFFRSVALTPPPPQPQQSRTPELSSSLSTTPKVWFILSASRFRGFRSILTLQNYDSRRASIRNRRSAKHRRCPRSSPSKPSTRTSKKERRNTAKRRSAKTRQTTRERCCRVRLRLQLCLPQRPQRSSSHKHSHKRSKTSPSSTSSRWASSRKHSSQLLLPLRRHHRLKKTFR